MYQRQPSVLLVLLLTLMAPAWAPAQETKLSPHWSSENRVARGHSSLR